MVLINVGFSTDLDTFLSCVFVDGVYYSSEIESGCRLSCLRLQCTALVLAAMSSY